MSEITREQFASAVAATISSDHHLYTRIVVAVAVATAVSCTTPNPAPTPTPTLPQCSVVRWNCTSTYGAIAYTSAGAWGIAYNYGSQEEANVAALGSCKQSSCSVVLQFRNACGALAIAPTGQAGWASAQSGDVAQAMALTQCYSK